MSKPLRILVLEDNPCDAELMLRELRRAGLRLDSRRVENASDFVREVEAGPDLILSDYSLPHFDGLSALEWLRERGSDIPFILVSGTVGEEAAVEAMKRGADDYLLKDRIARLGHAVERVLEERRQRRQRKRMEEALQLTHAHLHQLLEYSPAVIYTLELEAGKPRPVFVSENIQRLLGTSAADAARREWWVDNLHPEDRPRVLALAGEAFKGSSCSIEYRLRHHDGNYRWMEDNIRVVRDSSGQPRQAIGVWTDVTDRKRADERLREQAALLDAANDAIYVHDLDNNVLYWNRGAERLYGWRSAEVVGRKLPDIGSAPGNWQDRLLKEGNWSHEVAHRTRTGKPVTVFSRCTLLRDEPDRPRRILVINADVSEKKQLEAQFLRAQRLEAVGALASGIAHDLNNILAPILMIAPLLRSTTEDADGLAMIETVESCAKRGADIIKQLLTFGRGDPGTRAPLAVRHLLRDLQKIIRETFPRDIHSHLQVPDELWPVLGNATQINQALMNLCVNARDAMPEGGRLAIEARNATVDEAFAAMATNARPGPHVCVRVADNGSGVSPENLQRIFDPFFTTKDIGKGTGLGLSTVLGIVRGHDGFVRVQSEVGRGTAFELYFPATPESPAPAAEINNETLPRGNGECVLVVDDEAAVRDSLRRVLETHGYRVLLAAQGAEGLAVISEHPGEVRVVLTDLMMPVMNGPAMIRALRSRDPHLPCLGMSGLPDQTTIAEVAKLELPAFLTKPFSGSELLHALRKTLDACETGSSSKALQPN